jgi:hypothetical protein
MKNYSHSLALWMCGHNLSYFIHLIQNFNPVKLLSWTCIQLLFIKRKHEIWSIFSVIYTTIILLVFTYISFDK